MRRWIGHLGSDNRFRVGQVVVERLSAKTACLSSKSSGIHANWRRVVSVTELFETREALMEHFRPILLRRADDLESKARALREIAADTRRTDGA